MDLVGIAEVVKEGLRLNPKLIEQQHLMGETQILVCGGSLARPKALGRGKRGTSVQGRCEQFPFIVWGQ